MESKASKFGASYDFIRSDCKIGLSVIGYGDSPIAISYTMIPRAHISEEKSHTAPGRKNYGAKSCHVVGGLLRVGGWVIPTVRLVEEPKSPRTTVKS